jgi:hypothetical protein
MGFYFRKSFGSGPFRINFSKSGISYSAGVKGARVNFSNRGTYVTFGSHGIYYRKKISDFGQQASTHNPTNYTPSHYELHTITSSNVEEITDADSQDFIKELTEKGKKISYLNWLGLFPLLLIFPIFFLIFFSTEGDKVNQITVTKDFIKGLPSANANIRKAPNKKAQILGVVNSNEQFELIDEANTDWYKINFNGQEGYISKKFSTKVPVTTSQEHYSSIASTSLFDKNPTLFWTLFIGLSIFFAILLLYLKRVDKRRLLIEIYYDIDQNVKEVYDKFVHHFSELLNCSRVWQYLHSERTNDYKYSSGAAFSVRRKPLSKISTNKTPSRLFKTNVAIPYLGLINTDLYFFPERLIVKRGSEYGAIMYKNIQALGMSTQFIEDSGVPADAIVVDKTWRYLNKNGSPDKRFKNNYQIPICRYSEYTLQSSSGLHEKISTSKLNGFDNFITYIRAIGKLQENLSTNREATPAEDINENKFLNN